MTGPLQPVAVIEAILLRNRLPDLPMRPGAALMARVASRGEGGIAGLVIAGELLTATVPEEVRAGQTLRLVVAEATAERVVLRMEPPPAAAPPPPPPPAITVHERPAGGAPGSRGEAAVTLTYESAALGRLHLRVGAAPGAVTATIQVPAALLERARAEAPRLRESLSEQTGRPATVHVVAGSVDLRA